MHDSVQKLINKCKEYGITCINLGDIITVKGEFISIETGRVKSRYYNNADELIRKWFKK